MSVVSWLNAASAGEQVPSLSEVLALDDIRFELDLKGYGESFADGVLEAVRGRVCSSALSSPDPTLRFCCC